MAGTKFKTISGCTGVAGYGAVEILIGRKKEINDKGFLVKETKIEKEGEQN